MRLIIRLTLAAGIAYCLIAQAIAAPIGDMQPITASIAAINTGIMAELKAQFTSDPAIVDEFAPYSWNGAGAGDRYANDFVKVVAEFGMTNIKMTMGKPLFNYVTGDRAYVVVPLSITAMMKGKPYIESGTNVYSLVRSDKGWKIAAQTWSKRAESSNPY